MSQAGTQLSSPGDVFPSSKSLDLLAAKNATLRLRAPSGHIFSFTDLTAANGCVNFGHLNPAIEPSADLPADLSAGFYPPSAASYAAWLTAKLGLVADDSATHSVLYRAGKEPAVGAAIALAQGVRGGKVLILEGSAHSLAAWPPAGDFVLRLQSGEEFSAWDQVSCLIYEPIQTAAGYVPLSLPWLRGLSQAAQAAGVPVIADEAESGFFRFGKLSLAASEFLHPDIFLFGNSMTNGVFPTFAVVYPQSMGLPDADATFPTAAAGFAAAEAVARYIDGVELTAGSAISSGSGVSALISSVNQVLSQAGERLASNPALSAFHLAGPTLSLEVRGSRAMQLAGACESNGVLVGVSSDGRRIRIAPPITIPTDQLIIALKAIEKAAEAL